MAQRSLQKGKEREAGWKRGEGQPERERERERERREEAGECSRAKKARGEGAGAQLRLADSQALLIGLRVLYCKCDFLTGSV